MTDQSKKDQEKIIEWFKQNCQNKKDISLDESDLNICLENNAELIPEFSLFKNLKTITFSDYLIKNLHILKSLPMLESISINFMNLSDPKLFLNMVNEINDSMVKKVSLRHSLLSYKIIKQFKYLDSLEIKNCRGYDQESSILDVNSIPTNIKNLKILMQQLSNLDFSVFTELETIKLSICEINSFPKFSNDRLTSVCLSCNQIKKAVDLFKTNNKLQTLDLSDNPIEDLDISLFDITEQQKILVLENKSINKIVSKLYLNKKEDNLDEIVDEANREGILQDIYGKNVDCVDRCLLRQRFPFKKPFKKDMIFILPSSGGTFRNIYLMTKNNLNQEL